MNNKEKAEMLRATRTSPFHIYPSSGTVRSQSLSMIRDLNSILESVPEGIDVPPWVLMKVSQAAESIAAVENYVRYYNPSSK